jgi:glycosyltransferase involved in cell wall biosynthesis
MRTNINVAIVTGSLSLGAGGLFESVRIPAVRMAESGAAVSVYGLDDAQFDDTTRSMWAPTSLTAFRSVGPARLGYSPALLPTIAKGDHEVLHLHGIWTYSSYAALSWRRRTARPMVISPHGMMDPWALRHNRGRKALVGRLYENRNLRRATAMVALCRPEAEAMRAFGLTNPIAVIPNGVDLPTLSPEEDRRRSDQRRTMLFLGRIHPKKGIKELLLAWQQARQRSATIASEWRLEIAGWDDGNHASGLMRLRDELGLADVVDFPGGLFGESKAAAYRGADAFILPSYSEGMPMTVLEAWSYAKPVFMTDACNIPEGFAADAAIRIETDPTQIADMLCACLGNNSLLEATGRAGRALVEDRFTWDQVVEQRLVLYRWLVEGGAAPGYVEYD